MYIIQITQSEIVVWIVKNKKQIVNGHGKIIQNKYNYKGFYQKVVIILQPSS